MTDFPTLSYTTTSKIPTLSYSWSLKKVPLSGGAIIGSTPISRISKLKKGYVDAKEKPIYLYEIVYESWNYCMTLYMTHSNKLRGHFGALPGLPLTQFWFVFDVSVDNSWKKRNVWKGIWLFSWLENSRQKFGFHAFKPFLNISVRLSRPFFVKRNWLRQMVNAITQEGI